MSGQKQLRCYVDVRDDNGKPFCFGPGDTLPAWAEAKITNPNVWAGDAGPDGRDVGEPPREGKGSGKGAWETYAATLGLDVEGLTRDEIIDLVDGAGDAGPDGRDVGSTDDDLDEDDEVEDIE